jgi:hypothetical protein
MALVLTAESSVTRSLGELPNELGEAPVTLNVHTDVVKGSRLAQFALTFLRDSREPYMRNVTVRFTGDAREVQKTGARLSGLVQTYPKLSSVLPRFVSEVPQGSSQVEIMDPTAFGSRLSNHIYLFTDTRTEGAGFFSFDYAVSTGRMDFSSAAVLDNRYLAATEDLLGFAVVVKELKEVRQGLADLASRIKHALKVVLPLAYEALIQWDKNTLARLGRAA